MTTADRPHGDHAELGPLGQPLSFEEAYTKLGVTVQALETGGLALESATELYEEGIRLVRLCNQLLNTAELKITKLKDSHPDNLAEHPSEGDL